MIEIVETPRRPYRAGRPKKASLRPGTGNRVKVALKRPKKAKQTKKDIIRYWGLPEHIYSGHLRYQNPIEKGILWYKFSLKVRTRDVEKYGTCISCGREITVDTCDAGHFIPASSCGPLLLMNETNVNAECSRCNAWDDMHLFGYAEGLDERYGKGTAKGLREQHAAYKNGPVVKDFTRKEYEQKLLSV